MKTRDEEERDHDALVRRLERERDLRDGAREAYKALSRWVNENSNVEWDAFINQFERDHRTLQQQVIGLALSLLIRASCEHYGRDARNEYAHKAAKVVEQALRDADIVLPLPYI